MNLLHVPCGIASPTTNLCTPFNRLNKININLIAIRGESSLLTEFALQVAAWENSRHSLIAIFKYNADLTWARTSREISP